MALPLIRQPPMPEMSEAERQSLPPYGIPYMIRRRIRTRGTVSIARRADSPRTERGWVCKGPKEGKVSSCILMVYLAGVRCIVLLRVKDVLHLPSKIFKGGNVPSFMHSVTLILLRLRTFVQEAPCLLLLCASARCKSRFQQTHIKNRRRDVLPFWDTPAWLYSVLLLSCIDLLISQLG